MISWTVLLGYFRNKQGMILWKAIHLLLIFTQMTKCSCICLDSCKVDSKRADIWQKSDKSLANAIVYLFSNHYQEYYSTLISLFIVCLEFLIYFYL